MCCVVVFCHQNSTRRHPERHKKSENGDGRGERKREILSPPPFGAPFLRGPTFSWVWAPPCGALTHTKSRNGLPKLDWAKLVWAKIGWGQNWFGPKLVWAKIGQIRKATNGLIGQKRSQPTLAKPTLAKPTLAKPTLAKPTLAKVKVSLDVKILAFRS